MKKKFIIVPVISMILLTSCSVKTKADITDDGRKILKLAYMSLDTDTEKIINDYNNSSNQYYIETESYIISDPLYTPNEKLMLDIVSGKKLDLLYISDEVDYDIYVNKNMLADLYSFIDDDEEISRETFGEGILNALNDNGSLYEIPNAFYIETLIGKKEIWNDFDHSLTLGELYEKCRSCNAERPIANLSWGTVLTRYLPGKYIDFENGTCCFDNEEFKELLFNIKKDNENYNASNGLSSFLNNEAILYAWDINSFYSLDEYEAVFKSDPVIVGYPDETQNYNILFSANLFGILSCSDNPTGAFDFIKFYTSYDYQIENEDMFPVNRQAFEDRYNFFITCGDEMSSYFPNENINAQYKCTKENADKIKALIAESNYSNSIGLTLTELIADEIVPCITKEKNIDDACSELQSRAEIFLSESIN